MESAKFGIDHGETLRPELPFALVHLKEIARPSLPDRKLNVEASRKIDHFLAVLQIYRSSR
jgi:hypothetical protein